MNDHRGGDRSSGSDRRRFLKEVGLGAAIGLAGGSTAQAGPLQDARPSPGGERSAAARRTPIGVSTYSFWQFRGKRLRYLGVHRQGRGDGVRRRRGPPHPDGGRVERDSPEDQATGPLPRPGLDGPLHPSRLRHPDVGQRQTNIQKTLYQIDLAYRLGIPTMRINTGRWGTTKSFDD